MYPWKHLGKLIKAPKLLEPSPKSLVKDKKRMLGVVTWDFNGEKGSWQGDGKANVCWAVQRHWDTEKNFNKQNLLDCSLSTHLVQIIVFYCDGSLPSLPLSTFFQVVRGKVKVPCWVFWVLIVYSSKSICQRDIWGWKILLPISGQTRFYHVC